MNLGLYIIGDEILTGRRRDKHLDAVIGMLHARGHALAWAATLGDDLERLSRHFRQSIAAGEPVLSTGGIGGTPDDLTRQAMAAALDVPLEAHPEGLPVLQRKFGDALTPERRRMVEFPRGATLIPNPVNQIPGFSIAGHHFVPGFPEMARPMLEWVLDTYYRDAAGPVVEHAVRIHDCPESRLIPLMERLLAGYPGVKVFSLPHVAGANRSVELGVRGPADTAARAFAAMEAGLVELNLEWETAENGRITRG